MTVSNRWLAGTLSGLAGSLAVNLAHELTRQLTPDAPRVDVIGMRAVARISNAVGTEPPEHLRATTFAGDIAANSLYYSLIAAVEPEHAPLTGAVIGALAGVGGLTLPPPMGLGDAEVNRTPTTQALTVAYYLGGGLIAGLAYRALLKQYSAADHPID